MSLSLAGAIRNPSAAAEAFAPSVIVPARRVNCALAPGPLRADRRWSSTVSGAAGGVDALKATRTSKGGYKLNGDTLVEVQALLDRGRSLRAAARAVGLTHRTVSRALEQGRLRAPNRPVPEPHGSGSRPSARSAGRDPSPGGEPRAPVLVRLREVERGPEQRLAPGHRPGPVRPAVPPEAVLRRVRERRQPLRRLRRGARAVRAALERYPRTQSPRSSSRREPSPL